MTTSRACSVALLTLCAMSCGRGAESSGASAAVAVPSAAAADSAARFAQAFYDWYAHGGSQFEAAVRDSSQYFGPALLSGFQEDLAEQATHPGEVVGLDWDPIIASQDPCPSYRMGQPRVESGHVLVPVYCGEATGEAPAVLAELARATRSWVFVDFRHGSDTGSALSDLAQLRRDRAQDSARAHD